MTNKTHISRRGLVAAALGIGIAPGFAPGFAPAFAQGKNAGKPAIEVWKDPSCGCCQDWVQHLQDNGFAVKVNESGNSAARSRLGVDRKFGSCHTGLVGGYAIEGHVPAQDIKRLLKEKPAAIGLAVPGMPVGSPGMDGPAYENRKDAFDVLLLTQSGGAKVFQHYAGNTKT